MSVTQIVFVALGAAAGYLLGKHQDATAGQQRGAPRALFMGIGGGVLALALAISMLGGAAPPEWEAEVVQVRTSTELNRLVAENGGTVLVDFYADWCMPCRRMAPHVNEIARMGEAVVAVIDVDESPALAEKYQVISVPMLAVFRDGALESRMFGYHSLSELRGLVAAPPADSEA